MATRVRGMCGHGRGRSRWATRHLTLLATLAAVAGCWGGRDADLLGRVAWVRGDSLLARTLPAGSVQLVGAARGMREPRWSPSGQWLAIRTDSALRLVRLDGSGGQKLTTAAAEFAWAPTDDRIAYVAEGNLIVARAGGIGVVLFEKTATAAAAGVAWSPDGGWIAFGIEVPPARVQATLASGETHPRLAVVPARGGSPLDVTLPAAPIAGPLLLRGWTANGTIVAAIPAETARAGAAVTTGMPVCALRPPLELATDSARRPGAPAAELLADSVLPFADFVATAPKWPAVALVAGSGATWRDKAMILAAGGTRTRLSAPGRAAISPAWSPDGRRLAWAEMPETLLPAGADARLPLKSRRIVIAGITAGTPTAARPLGGEPGRQESPRWLRDSRHLLYVRVDDAGAASLRLGGEGERERTLVTRLAAPVPTSTDPGEYGYRPWRDVVDYWPGPPGRAVRIFRQGAPPAVTGSPRGRSLPVAAR